MDPVSAFGIATGAAGLADVGARALLGCVIFLRDLKKVPKEMRTLLSDLEASVIRLSAVRDAWGQDTSVLSTGLDVLDRQRLQGIIEEGHTTSAKLCDRLRLLLDDSEGSNIWRGVVCMVAQNDIESDIHRINRLNGEVTR